MVWRQDKGTLRPTSNTRGCTELVPQEAERYILDPAAAKALSSPQVAALLQPFLQGPCSIKQASLHLQIPLPRLHYWVQKFVKLDILRINSEQPRTGKAIKFYIATARRFILPAAVINRDHFLEHEATWSEQFYRSLEIIAPALLRSCGLIIELDNSSHLSLLSLNESGEPWDPLAPHHPAVLNTWSGSLMLEPQTAKALQHELMQIFRRFSEIPQTSRKRPYLLHLGLTPQNDE